MKGLLIKDIKLLKNQKSFLYILAIIAIIFSFSPGEGPSFAVGYFTFISGFLALSTISYDDLDHGLSFLFTLPVSRKIYIQEKYILGAGFSFLIWLVFTTLYFALSLQRNSLLNITEFWLSHIILYILLLLILSIFIPVHLKFGNERARVALMIFFGLVFASSFVISSVSSKEELNASFNQFINSFSSLMFPALIMILFLVSAAVLCISAIISTHIINHKEL